MNVSSLFVASLVSETHVCCDKTANARIMQFSLKNRDYLSTSSFCMKVCRRNFNRPTRTGVLNYDRMIMD